MTEASREPVRASPGVPPHRQPHGVPHGSSRHSGNDRRLTLQFSETEWQQVMALVEERGVSKADAARLVVRRGPGVTADHQPRADPTPTDPEGERLIDDGDPAPEVYAPTPRADALETHEAPPSPRLQVSERPATWATRLGIVRVRRRDGTHYLAQLVR